MRIMTEHLLLPRLAVAGGPAVWTSGRPSSARARFEGIGLLRGPRESQSLGGGVPGAVAHGALMDPIRSRAPWLVQSRSARATLGGKDAFAIVVPSPTPRALDRCMLPALCLVGR